MGMLIPVKYVLQFGTSAQLFKGINRNCTVGKHGGDDFLVRQNTRNMGNSDHFYLYSYVSLVCNNYWFHVIEIGNGIECGINSQLISKSSFAFNHHVSCNNNINVFFNTTFLNFTLAFLVAKIWPIEGILFQRLVKLSHLLIQGNTCQEHGSQQKKDHQ